MTPKNNLPTQTEEKEQLPSEYKAALDVHKYNIKQLRDDILNFTQDSYTTRLFLYLFNQVDALEDEISNYDGDRIEVMHKTKYDYLSKIAANWIKYSTTFRENIWDPNSPITKIIANAFLKKFIGTINKTVANEELRNEIISTLAEDVKNIMSEIQNEIKEWLRTQSNNKGYD